MKVPIRCVCTHATALGMSQAGLACTEAADGEGAAAAIAQLGRAPGTAVILIERALHDALPAAVKRQLRRDGVPILMTFPGPELTTGGPPPEEELLEILRQSLGYRVRLR